MPRERTPRVGLSGRSCQSQSKVLRGRRSVVRMYSRVLEGGKKKVGTPEEGEEKVLL